MEKLRLIQCGVGGFGEGWVKNHSSKSPDFDLAAIVDVSPDALAKAGDAVGIPVERRFKSLPDAIAAVKADAVLSVTPPVVHAEHARVGFEAGLHVMTEKPFADTIENAQRMLGWANAAGKQLLISQNYRYRGTIAALRQQVAEGTVGEFGHGHIDFYIPADFTGTFRETMPYVLLVDMAVHHIDLIRYVTGRNIEKITAVTFNPPWSWYKHHAGLKMVMELTGGATFSYSGDWSARGRTTSWNGGWRLQCAEGSIHADRDLVSVVRCARGWDWTETQASIDTPEPALGGQDATLADFAQAIRTGQPGATSGRDNLWTFGAVMAAVESAKTGQPVDVAKMIGK